jgi:hypothetical protein
VAGGGDFLAMHHREVGVGGLVNRGLGHDRGALFGGGGALGFQGGHCLRIPLQHGERLPDLCGILHFRSILQLGRAH